MNDELSVEAAEAMAAAWFAKSEGWDDWTPDQEKEEGVVRGIRLHFEPFYFVRGAAVIGIPDDAAEDEPQVVITGWPPDLEIVGWLLAGESNKDAWHSPP